jgi:hypothetical protein
MPETSRRSRRATRVLIVVVVLGLLTTAAVVLARYVFGDGGCANPPTEQERRRLESFLVAHVADARDLGWTVMDCDDLGQAYLAFTTSKTPVEVSASFLADPACSRDTGPDASATDVTCRSGGTEVSIFTEPDTGTWTRGELSPSQA